MIPAFCVCSSIPLLAFWFCGCFCSHLCIEGVPIFCSLTYRDIVHLLHFPHPGIGLETGIAHRSSSAPCQLAHCHFHNPEIHNLLGILPAMDLMKMMITQHFSGSPCSTSVLRLASTFLPLPSSSLWWLDACSTAVCLGHYSQSPSPSPRQPCNPQAIVPVNNAHQIRLLLWLPEVY